MRSIRDIAVHNQTVFLRVDFNVPLKNGEITEDARIKAALPTIEYLIEKGARVVIGSHLGRPKGTVKAEYRLQPVAKRLRELLGQEIHYVLDCIGPEVEERKAALQPGEVLLLENLRFHAEEEKNDLHFAEQLASGIDVYIADGFGVIHRKHASTYALPSLIFDKGAGFLIQEEVDALKKILQYPDQPFVVVIGGIKISDKVDVIRSLAPLADVVLIGGGVANTVLKGLGKDVGNSIVESDSVNKEQEHVDYTAVGADIFRQFETERPQIDVSLPVGVQFTKIMHPVDFVAAPNTAPGSEHRVIPLGEPVPEGWMFLDIGPKTQQLYGDILRKARTIFWNGPLGLFEIDAYGEGSKAVAEAAAHRDAYAVLGGGDTEAVVKKFGFQGRFRHVSTGGGASLNFLARKPLPGLEVLE